MSEVCDMKETLVNTDISKFERSHSLTLSKRKASNAILPALQQCSGLSHKRWVIKTYHRRVFVNSSTFGPSQTCFFLWTQMGRLYYTTSSFCMSKVTTGPSVRPPSTSKQHNKAEQRRMLLNH